MSSALPGDINPAFTESIPLFRAYGDDFIQIEGRRCESGMCIHHGEIVAPWGPQRLRDLKPKHLCALAEKPSEVLIIGTGRVTAFPSESVLAMLADAHIGYECMDTRSAARTYNILVGEGRNVSAAMLLPSARN